MYPPHTHTLSLTPSRTLSHTEELMVSVVWLHSCDISARRDTGLLSGSRWCRDFCLSHWWRWCGASDLGVGCHPHRSWTQCRCGRL